MTRIDVVHERSGDGAGIDPVVRPEPLIFDGHDGVDEVDRNLVILDQDAIFAGVPLCNYGPVGGIHGCGQGTVTDTWVGERLNSATCRH